MDQGKEDGNKNFVLWEKQKKKEKKWVL